MLNVISLGAGVQSSTMALMAAKGEITPMPDAAIFADTGWEPKSVYTHLDWLEKQLPFPTIRVSAGNIRDNMVKSAGFDKKEKILANSGVSGGTMPLFLKDGGMILRQCTGIYKIHPIDKKVKKLLGLKPRRRLPKEVVVKVWIGISTDEASRMKPSQEKWKENIWPLIDARMSRENCKAWFARHYPDRTFGKSACIACPYRHDRDWRVMKIEDPVSFADAVDFDKSLRRFGDFQMLGNQVFVHRSQKPLDEVDFRNLEDMGQLNMFEEECTGHCGV